MPSKSAIVEFLSHRSLVLLRPSRSVSVRGLGIDEQLGSIGYTISVAYLDDPELSVNLKALANATEGAILAVPAPRAEQAAKAVLDAGITRVWLQNGCESKEAVALCKARGAPAIHGACVLMYAEPVKSFHAFHRWLWKMFGLLAK